MEFSRRLLNRLSSAKTVTVLTGAGVSAESGVPTFRDPGGIWKKFKPEELANFEAFISNPDFVWSWYQHRREIMREVIPNAGHLALAEMETMFDEFYLVTQNIDNLHHRAGSKNITELHGCIERNYCINCKTYYNEVSITEKKVLKCSCGGFIRPDVVWFGELLPQEAITFSQSVSIRSDVFFSIGASAEVYPAASLPVLAKRNGAFLVEINPKQTPLSPITDEVLIGNSGIILLSLLEQITFLKNIETVRTQSF